jgi:hypothetical protein
MVARSRNHCCRRQAISITFSECVSVALVIQDAKLMRLLYCHLWPARLYNIFPHYLINGPIFGKKMWNIKCVLIFFTVLSESFIVLRKTQRDVVKYIYRVSQQECARLREGVPYVKVYRCNQNTYVQS